MNDSAVSEHSFTLDDTSLGDIKPLPYVLKKSTSSPRVKLPNIYPKFEVEFYDVVKSCAEYIDKIHDIDKRIKYTKELSKIFIIRHKGSAMRLFKELFDLTTRKDGD